MKQQFRKSVFMVGFYFVLVIIEVAGSCNIWYSGWQSDGSTNVSYFTCQTCFPGEYLFKNNTVVLPVNGSMDIYDCGLCNPNCITCEKQSTNCLTCGNLEYLAGDNTCQSCNSLITSCNVCTIDGCTQCITNYRIYNYENKCIFDCTSSFSLGCLTCNTTTCLSCQRGYVVDTSVTIFTCTPCMLINCQTCADGPKCSVCSDNFFLDVSNGNLSCATCSITYCQTCTHGPKCAVCQPNYNLVLPENLTCAPCTDIVDCQTCADGPKCLACRPTFYLVLPDKLRCESCQTIADCEICIDGPQCIKCSTNYILITTGPKNQCNKCPFGRYASSTNQCLPCPSNCLSCQQTTTGITCLPCPNNTVLDINAQACLRCDTNVKNCALCSSINVCTKCFYPHLLGDSLFCDKCEAGFQYIYQHCVKPIGCRSLLPDYSKCIACGANLNFMFDSLANTCKCLNGRYVFNINGSNICLPKCGDGILIVPEEQCDDGNVRDQDGCNDNCQLEPGFRCSSDSPSKCTLPFIPRFFEYNYAYKYEGTSRCKFSLSLSPPNLSLKYVDWSSYLKFNISDDQIVKSSKFYSYNDLTNEITIEIEYLRTLENMVVEFKLFSSAVLVKSSQKMDNPEKEITQSVNISRVQSTSSISAYVYLELQSEINLFVQLQGQNSKLLYQKQFFHTVFQSVRMTSLIISILILLQFFIGSYYHKMIGLETLQILQFFYFVRLVIEQNLTTLLQSMNVFKYTAYGGYSDLDLFLTEASETFVPFSVKTLQHNFVTVQLTKYFFTNVNLPLILPSLSLIVFLITLARKNLKRSEYMNVRDISLKDQYTTLRRSSQWVYDHFIFPYLNLFNMVLFFTTIMYLKFKPNDSVEELQEAPVIQTIEKINFPIHLTMAFLIFFIYCQQVFTSLEQFKHSRLTEAQKAQIPKSTYEQIEHDENNPDRPNYKPGYIMFYMLFYLSLEISLMVDILLDSSFNFGVEFLLGISTLYLIFVWQWKPYKAAVQFHNKALRLNHSSIVFFMLINTVVKRLQINITVFLILVYGALVLLLLVTVCGYVRIVVEYRFRKRLLDQPELMETGGKKEKVSGKQRKVQEKQRKQNLLKKNPFLFQNQVKQLFVKQGRIDLNVLTDKDLAQAKQKIRKQIYSDKRRMDQIKKEKYFPSNQPFIFNDFVAERFQPENKVSHEFKDIRINRKNLPLASGRKK